MLYTDMSVWLALRDQALRRIAQEYSEAAFTQAVQRVLGAVRVREHEPASMS
jgi:hypothetical protein